MMLKFFQVCREFEVDNGGSSPRLERELGNCFIASLEAFSQENLKNLEEIFTCGIPELHNNFLVNHKDLEALERWNQKQRERRIISPEDASVPTPIRDSLKDAKTITRFLDPEVRDRTISTSARNLQIQSTFHRGPWKFEVSILSKTSVLIIIRYEWTWNTSPQENGLETICYLEKAIEKAQLKTHSLDASFFWQFKEATFDSEFFFAKKLNMLR